MADPKTLLDVVDDAVKIVGGGLVGGLFSWLVALHNSKSQIQKLVFERRSKMLLEVAETLESFMQAYFTLNTYVHGLAAVDTSTDEGKQFAAERSKEINEMRFGLLKQASQVLDAQSKLMLLGESDCQKSVENISLIVSRSEQVLITQIPSVVAASMDVNVLAIREARKSFYAHMEKAYQKS